MKLKGINPFEQHVEKIVLGVAVAAVGGVAAWQFLTAPTVKVAGKDVAPGEVDAMLEQKANKLQLQLRGESSITIPNDKVVLASPSFADALRKGVTPAKQLAVASPSFGGMLVQGESSSSDTWYYTPQLAAVEMRSPVIQTADALTPEAAKEALAVAPSLKEHFTTSAGPQDVVWTTPTATIDLKGLRQELARSDQQASPPRSAIPGVWYQETPFIVDVVFERQKRRDDGTWGDTAVVPAFTPESTLSYRKYIDSAHAQMRDQMFSTLKDAAEQLQILQMPFFDTVNDAFVSPTVAGETDKPSTGADAKSGQERLKMQWRTQLQNKKVLLGQRQSQLEKLGGPMDDAKEKEAEEKKKQEERERKEAEKGSKGGKGGGGGFGMGGGGMQGRRPVDDANKAGTEAEKRKLQQRKDLTNQVKRIQKDIADLEAKIGVETTSAAPTAAKLPSTATDDSVLVWGHDLDVEPGQEYRYRCTARLYNPFFARGNQLVKEQEAMKLAQSFVIDTRVSEWSAPVRVSPRVRFFVTQASAGDGSLGMGTAKVEVYRLVDGQWRRSEMSVQPGERIGRVDDRTKVAGTAVDFTTDFYVASVVEDLTQKDTAGSSKRPAFVVVRQLNAGPEEERWPEEDNNDPERQTLRDEAFAAAVRDKEATTPAPPVGGGNNPTGPGGGPGGPTGPGGGGGLGGGSGGKGTGGGGRDRG